MKLFEKFVSLFKKSSQITLIDKNSELYKNIKENMDKFEKTVTNNDIRILIAVVKQLVMENQILKEVVINQNQILHNLVIVNQRIVAMLNTAMTLEDDLELDEDGEDVTETAVERSSRETAKKFGAN